MKIYLDVNGTMLYNKLGEGRQAPKYLKEFLQNVIDNHKIYWLTTVCNGDASEPIRYLNPYYDNELMELIRNIKPTSWDRRKLEAINLEEEFLWFDDNIKPSEKRDLKKAGKLGSFVYVNLYQNPDFWSNWLDI